MHNMKVYVLTAIHPRVEHDEKRGNYVRDEFDNVSIYNEKVGVFSSVKEAEKVIRQLVKQEEELKRKYKSWYNEYFCFVLDEHYLDDALYGEHEYKNVSAFESCRTYLHDGTLNCFSDLDDRCTKAFKGRKDPIRYVKKGDIALQLCGNHIEPVLVEEVSMTSEKWKSVMRKGVTGDVTDDSGVVFHAKGGHSHPFSPMVFPISCLPSYKMNKENIRGMKLSRKEYFESVCK